MRRAGMLCAVLGLVAAGCGGGGRLAVPLVLTCGSAVSEGTTVRITLEGNDFDFDLVRVTADIGTIERLTVDSPELLSFDYTAPTFPPGTIGPRIVTFRVTARPGSDPSECTVAIHLTPFVTSCTTTYTPDRGGAPTTGVFAGTLVRATITGGNFLAGGTLLVHPRGGIPALLTELPAGAPFTGPGQFRITSGTTIDMTVPDVFSSGIATILDGSPNVGPAAVHVVTPFGAFFVHPACFRYLPDFLHFEDFLFEVPGSVAGLGDVPGLSAPGKIAIGDVNADGVPDVVMLAQQTLRADYAPEAILFLSNTFGAVDRNGDGEAPDFAGSFTTQTINHPDMQTLVLEEARGQHILLANLDGDPQLEIIIPVVDEQGFDPVLIVDIEPPGIVGDMFVFYPPHQPFYTAGITVGDFDHTSPEPDIAVLYGDSTPTDRALVIFRSQGPFDYVPTRHDFPVDLQEYRPGAIGAGDFDRDGDDDLIWGMYDGGSVFPELRPIVVARVDADAGTVGTPQRITNLSGSVVSEIDVFDANGDGRVDALVYIGGEAQGTLTGNDHLGAGVATFLDPFSLEADFYAETPYRFLFWDRAGNGRGLTHADFDGDGTTDLATVNDFGEVLVLLGHGDGRFTSSGLSWQVVTGWTDSPGPVQSLDAFDFDRDGLAEIIVGDMSNPPFNLVYWLNASR